MYALIQTWYKKTSRSLHFMKYLYVSEMYRLLNYSKNYINNGFLKARKNLLRQNVIDLLSFYHNLTMKNYHIINIHQSSGGARLSIYATSNIYSKIITKNYFYVCHKNRCKHNQHFYIFQHFLLYLKRNPHKPSKIAASINFFSIVYVIGTFASMNVFYFL